MKILNLHGFLGKADNKNYAALAEIFPASDIISPKLDYMNNTPEKILDTLSEMVSGGDYLFVGQSLGGWYADKLSRKFSCPCILTNPCYRPHETAVISDSGISEEILWQYRFLSEKERNERAYTLCSDGDTLLPDNIVSCTELSRSVRSVHGSHSTIENIGGHISYTLSEIDKDMTLRFFGRGSAFADSHNSAYFIQGNDLIMLDCPASAFQKAKKMNPEKFDNVYILVTHTHGDHSGGVGTMLQYVWFASGMTKRATIVAPSEQVCADLEAMLENIEGCMYNKDDEKENWFNITTASNLNKEWLIAAVPTKHVDPLEGKCFGYHLCIGGKNVVYTGDTRILSPFSALLSPGSYLYTEAASIKSGVHLFIDEFLPEFVDIAESGVNVYLMHLDNEKAILEKIKGTPLKLAYPD